MEKAITVEEMRQMSWESMVRLENLFRKLFPDITAFKDANSHFTPRLLLTLLQNRGSELNAVDVKELSSLTSAMGELRDAIHWSATASSGIEEGNAQQVISLLQECSSRLDKLQANI